MTVYEVRIVIRVCDIRPVPKKIKSSRLPRASDDQFNKKHEHLQEDLCL